MLTRNDALLIVDVQNDFCPGGALPVPRGDRIIPILNQWIDRAINVRALIVASRDWHPPHHISFKERGGEWPVHCVQNTRGADFHPELRLPPETRILSKGQNLNLDNYSAFDGTGLKRLLEQKEARRVWVGGLAEDICVKATVLDGLEAGFEMHVIREATRPVDAKPDHGDKALEEMKTSGAIIES